MTLRNGITVLAVHKPGLPVLSANLRFGAGEATDPDERAGLADLAAAVCTKGTITRSATDIAKAVEQLGASLSAGADKDSSQLSLTTRSDLAGPAFEIFADTARNAVFSDDEIDRQRQLTLDDLSVSQFDPGAVASRALARLLYGRRHYGLVPTQVSLNAISRGDVTSFNEACWTPENACLTLSGDLTPEEAFELARAHFEDWTPVAKGEKPRGSVVGPPPPRTLVVDIPGAGQAAVYYGLLGPSRTSPDFFASLLATSILGGGYSARLNTEIRIKRGLSYGAGARLPSRRDAAPIVAGAQTRNDAAPLVLSLIETELRRLIDQPTPQDEMAARKAGLIGQFARDIETVSGLAEGYGAMALFGLPMDDLARHPEIIDAITASDIQNAAIACLDPSRAVQVIAGDADEFFDELRKDRPDAVRVAIGDLDFDSDFDWSAIN